MRTILTEAQIREGVVDLARRVSSDFAGRPLTVLGVLTGSLIFLSDFIRQLNQPLQIGLIQASSYRGRTTEAGKLLVETAGLPEIAGRDVLLLDDIFDTGKTLAALLDALEERQPRSLRTVVLLWKEGRQTVDVVPDYHGFKIPNAFVVGYGLDYDDNFRNLPYVAELEAGDF